MVYEWKINKKKVINLTISVLAIIFIGAQVNGVASPVLEAILGGIFFTIGYFMTFGVFDRVPVEDGLDEDGVIVSDKRKKKDDDKSIAVGLKYLEAITKANAGIPCPELSGILTEMVSKGTEIIELVQQDPENVHKVQKFLTIYLADASKISAKYAKLHRIGLKTTLDERYRELLASLVEAFNNQYDALRRNDIMELDAEIEVLRRRIKQESF